MTTLTLTLDLGARDAAVAALRRLAALGVLYAHTVERDVPGAYRAGDTFYGPADDHQQRGLIGSALARVDAAGNVTWAPRAAEQITRLVRHYDWTNRSIAEFAPAPEGRPAGDH